MFLAGGRLAYFGPPAACVDIFARFGYTCRKDYNPADMLIETLAIEPYNEEQCMERINKICDQYAESEEGRKFQQEVSEALRASEALDNEVKAMRDHEHFKNRNKVIFPIQFYALLQRSVLDNWRNPALVRAKIILKVFMGVFVGLLYLQTNKELEFERGNYNPYFNRSRDEIHALSKQYQTAITNFNGALYFLVNELTYATAMGILSFMPDDYPLVVREYHDGLYYLASYYIARCLSYVPLFTLDGLLMMSICYYMVGFVPTIGRFLSVLGNNFMLLF
jgi:hypothetical protein